MLWVETKCYEWVVNMLCYRILILLGCGVCGG